MPRQNDLCTICGKDFAGPVIHDHLWKRIAGPNEHMLCGFCMSDRMAQRFNRDLKLADLKPCPFNLFQHPHSWFAMLMKDEREPPANMAEWQSAAAELRVPAPHGWRTLSLRRSIGMPCRTQGGGVQNPQTICVAARAASAFFVLRIFDFAKK